MSKETSEKSGNKIKLENVEVKVEALSDGYYQGKIIPSGKKFTYQGVTKNGKLPLWVKPLGEIKKVKAESKEVNSIL